MDSILAKIKKTVGKIKTKINKEIIALLFSVVIFSFVFYSAFLSFKLNEDEVSEYMKSFKDNNSKYEDFVNNTRINIKNLVENSHIKELKRYDELIDEISYNKREDPFTKFSQ